jgi:hypothetical protein
VNIGVGGQGEYNISGGTLNALHDLNVADQNGPAAIDGQMNITGGVVNQTGGDQALFVGKNGGTGVLNISDGTLTVNRFQIGENANATGVVNQSGGTVTSNQWINIGHDAAGEYNISGGTLNALHDLNVGDQNGPAAVDGRLNVTGGVINHTGPAFFVGKNGSTGIMTVTGHDAAINATNYDQNGNSTLNSVLNNDGVTPVEVSGNTIVNGEVDVDLAGGVAFLQNDTHDLVGGGTGLTDNSTFNEVIWNKTVAANTIQATLNPAAGVGTLDLFDGFDQVGPLALNAGFVDIVGIDVDPLLVSFNVEVGGGATIQDLADFIAGGGNDVIIGPNSGFDLGVLLQAPGDSLTFAWDFSDFDQTFGTNSPTLVTLIGAGVPEPVSAVLLIGAAGALLVRRRRRV